MATMVVSVNGMMVDHSASSQTPEPAPMPEAQRDLIVEAMKVQMKQGQVTGYCQFTRVAPMGSISSNL